MAALCATWHALRRTGSKAVLMPHEPSWIGSRNASAGVRYSIPALGSHCGHDDSPGSRSQLILSHSPHNSPGMLHTPSNCGIGWATAMKPHWRCWIPKTRPASESRCPGLSDLGAEAPARVVRRTMRDLGIRGIPAGARTATKAHPRGLTAREQQILQLLSEGQSNEEISARLFISVRTVEHHVSAILGKLGVSTRQGAAKEARRLGLTHADYVSLGPK